MKRQKKLSISEQLMEKLKSKIRPYIPTMFQGMVDDLIDTNRRLIVQWLKENKSLIMEVIDQL